MSFGTPKYTDTPDTTIIVAAPLRHDAATMSANRTYMFCLQRTLWHLACALAAHCTNHIARTTATTPHATPTHKYINTCTKREIQMYFSGM